MKVVSRKEEAVAGKCEAAMAGTVELAASWREEVKILKNRMKQEEELCTGW